jgi:hypothetical protein
MVSDMSSPVVTLIPALEVAQRCPVQQAQNGLCYAMFGDINPVSGDVVRIVEAVPATMAAALLRKAYYFVPLAVPDGDRDVPLVSTAITEELSERAMCHRNVVAGPSEMVFISTGIMADRFALAFELFINVGHGFVDHAGVSPAFAELAWKHAEQDIRGETSQDAHEIRRRARVGTGHNAKVDEKAKTEFLEAAFADSIAVYLLSLVLDLDYYELREREYPLLAPRALGERLRKVAELFPPNPGYEFAIKYRRRG